MRKFLLPYYFSLILFTILFLTVFYPFSNKITIDEEKKQKVHYAETFFPVIVIGSSPEAVASAVASARLGVRTLLIDTHYEAGGLITLGKLNTLDMNYGPKGELLTRGIFLEFFKLNQDKSSLDIIDAKKAFETLLNDEPMLVTELGVQEIFPYFHDQQIVGIEVTDHHGDKKIYSGDYFIDATEDAQFAYLADCSFTVGQEDFGGPQQGMAVTQIFELMNVDWDKIQTFLQTDQDPHTGADNTSAWGYGGIMKGYKPQDPQIRLRGLNIGKQSNGHVLINSMHIFGVDALNPQSLKAAKEKAEKELLLVVEYLNHYAPGFEEAYLAQAAEMLYVRETRHLQGLYRLTIDDVLENRNFQDKIALASYPVDIQATRITDWGNVVGNPAVYSIPFRSLVPKEHRNLLVVGRSASYDSLAAGSARVIPVGMVTGQATGTAAAYAVQNQLDFHQIAYSEEEIREIQIILKEHGAYLEEFAVPNPLMNHWAYEGLTFLRHYNLVNGGYQNNYHLDDLITEEEFYILVKNLAFLKRLPNPLPRDFWKENQLLTLSKLQPYLSDSNVERLPKPIQEVLTRGAAFMIIKEWLEE